MKLLICSSRKILIFVANRFYSQHSQVTTANNQSLIPIARNISFRKCNQNQQATANFITDHPSIFVNEEDYVEQPPRASPFDILKKKAKDAAEKRELAAKSKYYGQSFNETLSAVTNERRLVVLMSWLEAQEKHIEKYRQFYLDRGFDVLNVKTSALDLLLPARGAKKISKDFARFMVEKQYSDVLLHGFSVGGYMFGQVLLDIDKQNQEMRKKFIDSIRGIVFDSLVPFEGICVGVANSITSNKLMAKVLEQMLRVYLLLGHNIATKYYCEASEKVWGAPLRCPTLFLSSKDDNISDYKIIERLATVWSNLGIECHKMTVDHAPHVQLFTKHNKAYVESVEKFLKRIKMD